MIWILGSLTLAIMAILYLAQKIWGETFSELPFESDEKKMHSLLWTEALRSLTSASWTSHLAAAFVKLSLRLRGPRAAILQMALSSLSWGLLFLWSLLLFRINGAFAVGVAVALYILFFNIKKISVRSWVMICEKLSLVFLLLAVTLILFEQTQRTASQIIMMAHEYDWVFFLSQKGFLQAVVLFFGSMVMTALIPFMGWSYVFVILFMSTGLMAFDNALVIVAAEWVAVPLLMAWQTRSLSLSARVFGFQYALISSLSILVSLLAMVLFKDQIFSAEDLSFGQTASRLEALMFCFFVFAVVQTATAMTWGHFAAKRKMDELELTNYERLPNVYYKIETLFEKRFIRVGCLRRLQILETQKQELPQLKGIPLPILRRHEKEIMDLQKLKESLFNELA